MKDISITKKLFFWIFAVAYGLILPIVALEIILGYVSWSSLNITLTYLGFLAHIDVTAYLLYRHITRNRDGK